MKIAVFTHYDAYFEPVAAITVPVMREYCERHGYHFEAVTERLSDRRVVWDKVKLLLNRIHDFDWLAFFDTDILITNLHVHLEGFVNFFQPDVVLSRDENGWNMGFLMVRNCPDAEKWLMRAWHVGERLGIGSEQHAMYVAMHERPVKHVLTLPQGVSNCYPLPEYESVLPKDGRAAWKPMSFLMHLPGMPNDKRVEIFTRVLPEIVR